MDKHDLSQQDFSNEPFTVEDVLNLTEANDPAVKPNPTLRAMMRFVLRRQFGPPGLTSEKIMKMNYQDFNTLWKRAVDAGSSHEGVPKPFIEGMKE